MTFADTVRRVEARLREADVAVNDFCARAGIARSTWTRWKSGGMAPNLATWDKVKAALFEMVDAE